MYYNHRIPAGTKFFLSSQTSGPALGLTYTYYLIQRVPEELFLGLIRLGRIADHFPLLHVVMELRMSGYILSLTYTPSCRAHRQLHCVHRRHNIRSHVFVVESTVFIFTVVTIYVALCLKPCG